MISIHNIRDVSISDYDTVLAIVRKLKENPNNLQHVPDLSPSIELLNQFLTLKENGKWNKETFNTIYVPSFLKEVSQNTNAWKWLNDIYRKDLAGEKICLVCHCKDEALCHRSIIAGILQGMGADVISESDYSQYYNMYKNY